MSNLRPGVSGSKKLTPMQLSFIDFYLATSNATKAALSAGYSEKTACEQGCNLLKNPKIAAELTRRRVPIEKKSALTAERVMAELASIAFLDPATLYGPDGKLLPINKMPEDTRRAIAGIEEGVASTKLRLSSKLGGLELAAKILNLVKTEQNTQAAVQIVIGQPPAPLPVAGESPKILPDW